MDLEEELVNSFEEIQRLKKKNKKSKEMLMKYGKEKDETKRLTNYYTEIGASGSQEYWKHSFRIAKREGEGMWETKGRNCVY